MSTRLFWSYTLILFFYRNLPILWQPPRWNVLVGTVAATALA
jgi:hypothetical protein